MKSRIFLAIFALPFCGVSIWMGTMMVNSLLEARAMKEWVEVPATILSTELKVSHGDSTTYQVQARYRYDYEGKTYTGDRVSIHKGSDNLGSYHQDMSARLKAARTRGEPVSCFVNPADPSESILDRSPRMVSLLFYGGFVLVFGLAGFGMLLGGILSARKRAKAGTGPDEIPDKVWKDHAGWHDKEGIPSSDKAGLIGMGIFAVFWNAISWPAAITFWMQEPEEKFVYIFIYLFPLIGLLLLGIFLYQLARYLKYGRSLFVMEPKPGVIGGPVSGFIQVKRKIDAPEGFTVRLSCVHRVERGSGKNRSTDENILWEDDYQLSRELLAHDQTQTAIPVLFGVPFDLPSSGGSSRDEIVWKLKAHAASPGVDYGSTFDIPVFKTSRSSSTYTADESAIQHYKKEVRFDDLAREQGLVTEPVSNDGLRLTFPRARTWGVGLMLVLVAAVFGAVSFMVKEAPMFFRIIFGLTACGVLLAGLNILLTQRSVEVVKGRLTRSGGFLGTGGAQAYAAEEVKGIIVSQGAQSGNRVYFRLQLELQGGRKKVLGTFIQGRRNAERIAEELQRRLFNG